MKGEISAGGVVVRKKGTTWEVLLVRDMNHAWTFPKGVVEKGEDLATAARREIGEEVGLTKLTELYSLPVIHYMYQRNGLIRKAVHYFVFESTGDEIPVGQKEEGIHDPTWMSLVDAIPVIGYPKTNKGILEQTAKLLQK